jgi:hypothetical protein
MDTINNSSSPVVRMIPALMVFAGLIALYYLYQYLFGYRSLNAYDLVTKTQNAKVGDGDFIKLTSDKLPGLYEGGEFTVSTWFYVNNWSYRSGKNKCILRVGGSNFDTIRIYLGGTKPKLNVRIHTRDSSSTSTTAQGDSLANQTLNATFNTLQTDSTLLDSPSGCDLPEIDLQRWVNLVVAVNGKLADIYIDGKLARSCVLPSHFKVDSSYSAYVIPYGGFGGEISTTVMYDMALNPEMIYKNYIAGPQPITSFSDMLSSFFTFGINVSIDSK